MTDGDLDISLGRSQLGIGAVAGVAAYVVGFLGMFLPGPIGNPGAYPPRDVLNATITRDDLSPGDGPPPGADPGEMDFPLTETLDGFSSAGGLFYNAHFVDLTIGSGRPTSTFRFRTNVLLAEQTNSSTAFGALSGERAEIVLAGLPIPPLLLFAIPVVLLAVGGYLVNRRTRETLPTPETAVASGSAVVLGYLPLVAIGAAMVRFRSPEILFGGIDVLGAIAIAGVVYPVTFGGLGGYAWHVHERREASSEPAATPARHTTPAGTGAGSTADERQAQGDTGRPEARESGGPPATATTTRVTMTDELSFAPETITVTAGDTVTWENDGSLTFTVTAYENSIPRGVGYFASGGFDAEETAREAYPEGGIQSGESYSHTFETPGTYEYFCVPQEKAGMVGTVEVRER